MWNLDTFYVPEDVLVQVLVPKVLEVSLCPKLSELHLDMNKIYVVHLAYYVVEMYVKDVNVLGRSQNELIIKANNCFVLAWLEM